MEFVVACAAVTWSGTPVAVVVYIIKHVKTNYVFFAKKRNVPHHDPDCDHDPTDSKVNLLLADDGGGDGLSALAAVDGGDDGDIDAPHYATAVHGLLDSGASSHTALVLLQVPRTDSYT